MNKSDIEAKNRIIKRNQKQAYIILFAGIAILLIAPYLFTRSWFISFTSTGQIGDTIGGITAPIVNLIAAVLVYLSFRQQLVANEIQIELIQQAKQKDDGVLQKEILLMYFREIERVVSNLKYKSMYVKSSERPAEGSQAIKTFVSDFKRDKTAMSDANPFYNTLFILLHDIFAFLKKCDEMKDISPVEKGFFKNRMYHLYFYDFKINLRGIEDCENIFAQEIRLGPVMNKIDGYEPEE